MQIYIPLIKIISIIEVKKIRNSVGNFLSKEKDQSKLDLFKKKIADFAKLKENEIDEYIVILKKLLENNEIVIGAHGGIKADFGEITKYNPKFIKSEEVAMNKIKEIITFVVIDSSKVTIYEDLMTHKKIQYLIRKLIESKLYEIICARIFLDRNSYLESEYQYLTRTFPSKKKPLTIKSCEVKFAYNDNIDGITKEIILEFDEIQLKKIVKQLQEALDKFRE